MLQLSQRLPTITVQPVINMSQQEEANGRAEDHHLPIRPLLDSLLQLLYSLTLLSEGWRRMAKAGNLEQADEALAEMARISQQALRELRLLMDALSLPVDDENE